MASITIRNLDEPLKGSLRLRAARHGRSMEEEVRHILRTALSTEERPTVDMAEALRRRFAGLGGHDLDIPPRDAMRHPPGLDATGLDE